MEKALFSNIRSELIQQINSAQHNIKIAMAWFTSHELFSALLNARTRGVRVELVLLDNATNWNPWAPDFNELIQQGGIFRIATAATVPFLHHKFCIIDGRCLITGSYNWTYYAEHRNTENAVLLDNSALIDAFLQEFERLTQELQTTSSAPRYTWEDIEGRDDVDFYELNNDVDYIIQSAPHGQSYQKPSFLEERAAVRPQEKKDIPSSPKREEPKKKVPQEDYSPIVQVVDTKRNAYAKYDIGLEYGDEKHEELSVLISKGTLLPFETKIKSENADIHDIILAVSRRDEDKKLTRISTNGVKELAGKQIKTLMEFEVYLSLNEDGYLKINCICQATNLRKPIQLIDLDLVQYGE